MRGQGLLNGFVGVRQRRVLGAWEHARMASSSNIRPARSKRPARARRFGAVAAWWRLQRGDLAKDAIISVVVGVPAPFRRHVVGRQASGTAGRIGDAIAARQDVLAKSIADRQDDLARDLANQAEVLENTRFVRQIATSKGKTPKPFASINLRGAQLGGLPSGVPT